jgi:hypothetical protein
VGPPRRAGFSGNGLAAAMLLAALSGLHPAEAAETCRYSGTTEITTAKSAWWPL